ncbi:MAG: hypothetical protein NTY08_07285 [Proteobacteria bacterium]|nr:hypothetical protein [Pseudomonadota bacterium]
MPKIDIKPPESKDIGGVGEVEVEVYHTMEPTESQANKNYLQRNPYSLVMPWEARWPSVPKMPNYPTAMIEDARLTQNSKMNIKMMINDPNYFKRLWLQDSRTQYVESYLEDQFNRRKLFEKADLLFIKLELDRTVEDRLKQHQLILEGRTAVLKIRNQKRDS